MSGLIILYFFGAVATLGLLYYIFIPLNYQADQDFLGKVTDPTALKWGVVMYGAMSASIIVIFGAIIVNAYQSQIRHRAQDQGFA